MAFVICGVLMFSCGFVVNEFINNKTETQLRDRLEMIKEVKGALATLPNEALKQKTLAVVAALRELGALHDKEDAVLSQRYKDKILHLGPDYSTEDILRMKEAWSEMSAARAANNQHAVRRYEELYQADAVLLREELIARLPERIKQQERIMEIILKDTEKDILQGPQVYNAYNFAYGSGSIYFVAIDLELLAKLLPNP